MRNLQIPDNIQNLVSGIMSLAAQAGNSNRDSNSLGAPIYVAICAPFSNLFKQVSTWQ